LCKKFFFLAFASTLLFSTILNIQFKTPLIYASSKESLTSQESQAIALVNGTNAYNYDLELEKIALNRSVANYSFRAAGSTGANEAANWIAKQFESFGLETYKESFQFTTWNLLSQPELTIYDNAKQTAIQSFQSEHYSWPTPQNGVFSDLVVLPLPSATNRSEIGLSSINATEWSAINTTGKIVLIGGEVRWSSVWEQIYKTKLTLQPPAVVVYTWWYNWMSFTPPVFSSGGGRPLSNQGPYYWNLNIPVGRVNYEDGLLIRSRENSVNVSARINIQSAIGNGPHFNVVGKLHGQVDPGKFVIFSGHYDTVMDSGFCDNGAGMAGVIELARIIMEVARRGLFTPTYTIQFIAFAGEELSLVGSTNYIIQHKAEMKDIIAVINLDSIGSDSLKITRTSPSRVFDLDELILKAAGDSNINATETDTRGSDQEAFRDPSSTGYAYSWLWPGFAIGIGDATPVESSAMLVSYPLLYSDKWKGGKSGWIHTSYDNSTSTRTLNWVEPNKLEDHIKVAALSAVRISQTGHEVANSSSLPWWTIGVAVVAGITTVMIVYFVRLRKPSVKDVVQ